MPKLTYTVEFHYDDDGIGHINLLVENDEGEGVHAETYSKGKVSMNRKFNARGGERGQWLSFSATGEETFSIELQK